MSACSKCGAVFSCGMVDTTTAEACWCTALPTAPRGAVLRNADGSAKTCMCPACLGALRARRQSEARQNTKF
ncbi:hypothetical protein D3C87_173120 [compost metagenome]